MKKASLVHVFCIIVILAGSIGCGGGGSSSSGPADERDYVDIINYINNGQGWLKTYNELIDWMEGTWRRTDITVYPVMLTLNADGTFQIVANGTLAETGQWLVSDCDITKTSASGKSITHTITSACDDRMAMSYTSPEGQVYTDFYIRDGADETAPDCSAPTTCAE